MKKSGTFWFVLVLVLVVLLLTGFLVQVNVSVKVTRMTDLPASEAWKLLTEMDHQVFWRTNLINVIKVPDSKGEIWKEIFSGDHERKFKVVERIEGEKLVRAYEGDANGQETLSVIVLPDKAGSRIALIDTIRLVNPLHKILLKLQPSSRELRLKKFNAFLGMFTNSLLKEKSGDSRSAPSSHLGTN